MTMKKNLVFAATAALLVFAPACGVLDDLNNTLDTADRLNLFDARPMTPEETEQLVSQAWQAILNQGGGLSGFDQFVTIAIAPPQMNTGKVRTPDNLEGDIDARLRALVSQNSKYEVKDEGWLRRQIGDDVNGLYDGAAAESVRRRLGTNNGVQYVLVPRFSATGYEKTMGDIITYTLRLSLVNVTEEATGSIIDGSSTITLE
ncbi:MAG: hypothetical protein R3F20_15800 [Planctomycetota bacterium]